MANILCLLGILGPRWCVARAFSFPTSVFEIRTGNSSGQVGPDRPILLLQRVWHVFLPLCRMCGRKVRWVLRGSRSRIGIQSVANSHHRCPVVAKEQRGGGVFASIGVGYWHQPRRKHVASVCSDVAL